MILEVACCFDMSMDLCFSEEMFKYQPLVQAVTVGGYSTELVVRLGHVRRLCVR